MGRAVVRQVQRPLRRPRRRVGADLEARRRELVDDDVAGEDVRRRDELEVAAPLRVAPEPAQVVVPGLVVLDEPLERVARELLVLQQLLPQRGVVALAAPELVAESAKEAVAVGRGLDDARALLSELRREAPSARLLASPCSLPRCRRRRVKRHAPPRERARGANVAKKAGLPGNVDSTLQVDAVWGSMMA